MDKYQLLDRFFSNFQSQNNINLIIYEFVNGKSALLRLLFYIIGPNLKYLELDQNDNIPMGNYDDGKFYIIVDSRIPGNLLGFKLVICISYYR